MTKLTDRQVACNLVSKGAVVLGQLDAGWSTRIGSAVDVADEKLGPLGQLFGDTEHGLQILGMTQAEAAECGYVSQIGVQPSAINDVWNDLLVGQSPPRE